jgi:hypothetical protein
MELLLADVGLPDIGIFIVEHKHFERDADVSSPK